MLKKPAEFGWAWKSGGYGAYCCVTADQEKFGLFCKGKRWTDYLSHKASNHYKPRGTDAFIAKGGSLTDEQKSVLGNYVPCTHLVAWRLVSVKNQAFLQIQTSSDDVCINFEHSSGCQGAFRPRMDLIRVAEDFKVAGQRKYKNAAGACKVVKHEQKADLHIRTMQRFLHNSCAGSMDKFLEQWPMLPAFLAALDEANKAPQGQSMFRLEKDDAGRFVRSCLVPHGAVGLLCEVGSNVFAIDACHIYLPYFDHVVIVFTGRAAMSKNIPFLFALVPSENEEHYTWTLNTAKAITTTVHDVCVFDDLLNKEHCGIWCDMQKGLEKVRVPYVFATNFTR